MGGSFYDSLIVFLSWQKYNLHKLAVSVFSLVPMRWKKTLFMQNEKDFWKSNKVAVSFRMMFSVIGNKYIFQQGNHSFEQPCSDIYYKFCSVWGSSMFENHFYITNFLSIFSYWGLPVKAFLFIYFQNFLAVHLQVMHQWLYSCQKWYQ